MQPTQDARIDAAWRSWAARRCGMARLERAVSLAEHAGHRCYRLTGPCALMICWKAAGGSLLLHWPAELRAATSVMLSR
jgi:hypothetical protein